MLFAKALGDAARARMMMQLSAKHQTAVIRNARLADDPAAAREFADQHHNLPSVLQRSWTWRGSLAPPQRRYIEARALEVQIAAAGALPGR